MGFSAAWQRTVARFPDAPAVRTADDVVTYREFDLLQRRIAAVLPAHTDAGDVVGVVVPKTIWSLAAMFAVAAARRTALLLEPSEPSDRWHEHCARTGVRIVLAEEPAAGALLAEQGYAVVDPGATRRADPISPERLADDDDPARDAWILSTSGSTGVPKLVGIPQELISDLWSRRVARNDSRGDLGSDVMVFAPLASASARTAIFQAWAGGACAMLVDTVRAPPDRILAMIDDYDVRWLHLGPWLLRSLVRAASRRGRGSAGVVMITSIGAPMGVTDIVAAQHWFPNATIQNSYGLTETRSVGAATVPPGAVVTSGDDLAIAIKPGFRVRVVRADGSPAGPGEQGEIWVHSPGARAHYVDAPDLVVRTVVEGSDGTRWFRTGDLGRLLADGRLLVDGRDDARVKINGVAVDLNGVAAAVRSIDGVADAEVSVIDRNGAARLVAWVVSEPATRLSVRDLRAGLTTRLAPAMVPHVFREVAELPRLASGKADRVALLAAATADLPVGGQRITPRSPLEHDVAARFEVVLDCSDVAVNESFFELGGDSLGALEIVSDLVEHYGVSDDQRCALESAMIADGTVGALAEVLRAAQADGSANGSRAGEDATMRPDGVSVLVMGRGRPDSVPIVLLPGGAHAALEFRPLVRRLDGQRIVALTPRGFRSRKPADRSLDRMVGRYADALEATESRGEFVLIGFSFGALVAQHLAAELAGRGATVARLVLIDGPRPGAPRPGASPEMLRVLISAASPQVRKSRVLVSRAHSWFLAATAGVIRREGQAQAHVFLTHSGRLSRSASLRNFDGPTLVIRSEQSALTGLAPDLGWSAVCTGLLETVDLPGSHHGVILEPSVAIIASRLEQVMADSSRPEPKRTSSSTGKRGAMSGSPHDEPHAR